MKQKNQQNQQPKTPPTQKKSISKRGVKVILAGISLLVVGFFVLTKTDPLGQNLASKLAPFLILGAYAVIGIGIILPDPEVPGQKTGLS